MASRAKDTDSKTVARLGSLLLLSELISTDQMSEAMEIASALSLPFGKVLVMLGFINRSVLAAVIDLQSLLKDKLVDVSLIKKALVLVNQENISASEALNKCGWVPKDKALFNKLGELLKEAGIISEKQLIESLQIASTSQMPLGRVLVLHNFINESTLWSALNAQVLLRDNRITRLQAISALKAAYARHMAIEHSLMEQGIQIPSAKKIKLGDIFVMAGMLSEHELLDALELCLLQEKPLGEVLLTKEILTKQTIETALEIQNMVGNNKLPPMLAGELLKQVIFGGKSIPQAVAELGLLQIAPVEKIRLGELFKLAGVLTEHDINEALRLSIKNTSLLGKILVATGHIDENILHSALQCQFMLREGFIDEEQGVIALNYCQRMHCTFDESMKDLGWPLESNLTEQTATKS